MEFQLMLPFAVLAQLCALNTGPVPRRLEPTKRSSARFGVGAKSENAARSAVISPRAAALGFPLGTARAVRMRAPFTWSGDQFGCRASICAAVPETTGAAN